MARKARRSKPEQGFPSKELIGVRAKRIASIQALMASGQWGGRITEIALAREWSLSLDYVRDLASLASANNQIAVTNDFASGLRQQMLQSTLALKAKLGEVVFDESRHGAHDRYECSEDGVRWYEVNRKDAMGMAKDGILKVRRIPCVPVAALPSFVQTAIRADEAVDRLLSSLQMERAANEAGAGGGGGGPTVVNITYTLSESDPKPDAAPSGTETTTEAPKTEPPTGGS